MKSKPRNNFRNVKLILTNLTTYFSLDTFTNCIIIVLIIRYLIYVSYAKSICKSSSRTMSGSGIMYYIIKSNEWVYCTCSKSIMMAGVSYCVGYNTYCVGCHYCDKPSHFAELTAPVHELTARNGTHCWLKYQVIVVVTVSYWNERDMRRDPLVYVLGERYTFVTIVTLYYVHAYRLILFSLML